MRRVAVLLSTLFLCACRTTSSPNEVIAETVAAKELMHRSDIASALAFVNHDRESTVAEWRAIVEIPAPSSHEEERAAFVERILRSYSLSNVHRDGAGNVIATRPGRGGGKRVVFDAHLDTVFPMGTDVRTRIEGERLFAPGVGDDARNIEAMLAMIRAMNEGKVETKGDITFVFTVSEESDYRGALAFLKDEGKTIDRYVALDGGFDNFTDGGIGMIWTKYHFLGAGGHTRSETPPFSATIPAARAITRISRLRMPNESFVNVGMTGAGDVFNAKASDAWFSVDLRSNDQSTLDRLDAEIDAIVQQEARRYEMKSRREAISSESVATLPGHHQSAMVRTTEGVFRAFGFTPKISNAASNHTSVALRAGIPAIGTGSTPCDGAHSLGESCEIEPLFLGIKRNIVLAVALSE